MAGKMCVAEAFEPCGFNARFGRCFGHLGVFCTVLERRYRRGNKRKSALTAFSRNAPLVGAFDTSNRTRFVRVVFTYKSFKQNKNRFKGKPVFLDT